MVEHLTIVLIRQYVQVSFINMKKLSYIVIVVLILYGYFMIVHKPSFKAGALPVFSIYQGGTGTSTLPAYGKVLVGNSANNGYDYVSTSTFSGGGGGSGTVSSGLAGQIGYYNSSGTTIIGTSTNPLYVTAINATTTTATSTFIGAVSIGATQTTAQDNLISINGQRTYTNSGTTQSAAGMVNINNGSNGREAVEIFQPSSDTVSSPSLFRVENDNVSSTNILDIHKTLATGFAANLLLSLEGQTAPAAEFKEDPWFNTTTNQLGAGDFECDSHNNDFRCESRNNTNTGFTTDFMFSSNFSSTTSGRMTIFPSSNSTGSGIVDGNARLELYGTTTVADLMDLTSTVGATNHGDLFVVKEAGNVGIGTSSPASKLVVRVASNGDGLMVDGSATGPLAPQTSISSDGVQKMAFGFAEVGGNFANFALTGDDILRATNGTSGNLILTNQNNAGIAFGSGTTNANDTQKAIMTQAGLWGYATATPQYLLDSFSSTLPQLALSAGAGLSQWTFRNAGGTLYVATSTVGGAVATSSTAAFSIDTNGKVFFPSTAASTGVQTGAWCFDSNGQLIRESAVCTVSARKFKTDIQPLSVGLTDLEKMNFVSYFKKVPLNAEDSHKQMGVIADDVAQISPDLNEMLVTYDGGGTSGDVHAFRYDQFTALLGQSIKDLDAKVQALPQSKPIRSAEENWQDVLIGLLIIGFGYQQIQIKRLKK